MSKFSTALSIGIVLGLSSSLAAAHERFIPNAKPISYCLLEVSGEMIIHGPCRFHSEKGGSFQIVKGDLFVYINLNEDGTAEGFWNDYYYDDNGARHPNYHAEFHLGTLIRYEECWTNDHVKVCAKR